METWCVRPGRSLASLGCTLAISVLMKKLSSAGAWPTLSALSTHGVDSTKTCDSQMICVASQP